MYHLLEQIFYIILHQIICEDRSHWAGIRGMLIDFFRKIVLPRLLPETERIRAESLRSPFWRQVGLSVDLWIREWSWTLPYFVLVIRFLVPVLLILILSSSLLLLGGILFSWLEECTAPLFIMDWVKVHYFNQAVPGVNENISIVNPVLEQTKINEGNVGIKPEYVDWGHVLKVSLLSFLVVSALLVFSRA